MNIGLTQKGCVNHTLETKHWISLTFDLPNEEVNLTLYLHREGVNWTLDLPKEEVRTELWTYTKRKCELNIELTKKENVDYTLDLHREEV